MILLFVLLFAIAVWGVKLLPKPSLASELNCFSRDQALALNGLSILLVFVCHTWFLCLRPMGYESANVFDECFLTLRASVRQLCVASFLFFSGYGVVEQIKARGMSYVNALPAKRILVTWLNFAVAICVYAAANFAFCSGTSVKDIVLSFTGFRQIGNPSWYIVCILWAYFAIYLSAKILKGLSRRKLFVGLVTILMLIYVVGAMILKPGCSWWWDTALVVPFGVAVSLYKPEEEVVIRRYYYPILFAMAIAFIVLYETKLSCRGMWNNLVSVAFMSVVLLVTCKVKLQNRVLDWAGRHVFPIYIYHMLFFLIARSVYRGEVSQVGALSIVGICLLMTVVTACCYRYWQLPRKDFCK